MGIRMQVPLPGPFVYRPKSRQPGMLSALITIFSACVALGLAVAVSTYRVTYALIVWVSKR